MEEIEVSPDLLSKSFKRNINHIERSSLLSSKYLFHFTDAFENLTGILTNGFKPSIGDGEIQAYQYEVYELATMMKAFGYEKAVPEVINIPICCFCDIPPKLAKVHRKNYGYYSIGLSKNWGIANRLNPLIYMPNDTYLHSRLSAIFSISKREHETGDYSEMPVMNLFYELKKLRYIIKPYSNVETNYKYYDEREWRYIAPNPDDINYDDPEHFLKFEKGDIYRITVRYNWEKREYWPC